MFGTERGRVRRALLGGAAAVLASAAGWTVGAAAAPVPNPCSILPASTISSAVGLEGVSLTGALSTRPDGPVRQSLCTYKHGAAELEIFIGPHVQSGGSGGPPGWVNKKPSGLGPDGGFAYDLNPKYLFANAYFTKGGFDGGVWDNGKLPNASILSLARKVYAALA